MYADNRYPSPSAGSRVVRAVVITDGPLSCIDFAEHDMKSIASYPQTKYLRACVCVCVCVCVVRRLRLWMLLLSLRVKFVFIYKNTSIG